MIDSWQLNILCFLSSLVAQDGRPLRDRSSHNPRWPTFPEFVNYLVLEHRRGHGLDMHWTPITEFCSPCQVEFDMILKFDTLDVSTQVFYLFWEALFLSISSNRCKNLKIFIKTVKKSFYSQYKFYFSFLGFPQSQYYILNFLVHTASNNLLHWFQISWLRYDVPSSVVDTGHYTTSASQSNHWGLKPKYLELI